MQVTEEDGGWKNPYKPVQGQFFWVWQKPEKYKLQDFPGLPVVRDLPCNAEDSGSIPGRGTKFPQAILHSQKENGKKKITTGREVAELFFAGDRIICLGNPIESTGKLLEMVRELSNLAK